MFRGINVNFPSPPITTLCPPEQRCARLPAAAAMASSTSLKSLDVDSDEEDGFLPERGRILGSPKPPPLCAFLREEMRSLLCSNDGSSSGCVMVILLISAAFLVIVRMVYRRGQMP